MYFFNRKNSSFFCILFPTGGTHIYDVGDLIRSRLVDHFGYFKSARLERELSRSSIRPMTHLLKILPLIRIDEDGVGQEFFL